MHCDKFCVKLMTVFGKTYLVRSIMYVTGTGQTITYNAGRVGL